MQNSYLNSSIKQFEYYKNLGNKTFTQLNSDQLFWSCNEDSNSIAILVKHLVGNMKSRWTDFLTEDGEKEWRNRDNEFENPFESQEEMLASWESGWACLFSSLHELSEDNLEQNISIRNQKHTVTEAINRQLCHYSYHVGQIVFLGKFLLGEEWKTLSIAKGTSKEYNIEKTSESKN